MQDRLFGGSVPAEEARSDCRDLVGLWVDTVEAASGHRPPKQTVGRMAKVIKDLLETHPADLVGRALVVAAEEGRSPAAVPDLMLRVQTQGTKAKLREWVATKGWPTGTRFKRGEQSGTYVPDPLGYDRAPYRVPWGAPTRDELQRALEALRENG